MTFEIVAIGDEVLAGFTINSNAAFISRTLALSGWKCTRQTAIPDDFKHIEAELGAACARSPLVICTGGLGPTLDDCTRAALAKLFQSELKHRPDVAEELKARYGDLPLVIENQAVQPEKAQILPNRLGTAPGLWLERPGSVLVALPGVPSEMRALVIEQLVPRLGDLSCPDKRPLRRILNVCRQRELVVDGHARALMQRYPQVGCGIYPGIGTLSVHLTADENVDAHADMELESAATELKQLMGKQFFPGDEGDLAHALHVRLRRLGMTLSVAESCTGGLLAATLVAMDGASDYFLGGFVCYSNALKASLLGVDLQVLERYGAVSAEVVSAMAFGAKDRTGSDYSLAISGVAGPSGGTAEKPVGTVWLSLVGPNGELNTWLLNAKGDRRGIIQRAVSDALAELWLRMV